MASSAPTTYEFWAKRDSKRLPRPPKLLAGELGADVFDFGGVGGDVGGCAELAAAEAGQEEGAGEHGRQDLHGVVAERERRGLIVLTAQRHQGEARAQLEVPQV